MQHYDVAIIGGGIGGLMSAYELATKAPGAKVVLFEKGHDIEKRACPIVTGKAPTCIKCPSCAIMEVPEQVLFPTAIRHFHRIRRLAAGFSASRTGFGLHRAGRRYFAALRRACRALHAQQRAEEKMPGV
ncbi:MAG: FAD-dependent oxidoreductase [Ruthenibacterium lactatiformans]